MLGGNITEQVPHAVMFLTVTSGSKDYIILARPCSFSSHQTYDRPEVRGNIEMKCH